jgi:hypothetical protein
MEDKNHMNEKNKQEVAFGISFLAGLLLWALTGWWMVVIIALFCLLRYVIIPGLCTVALTRGWRQRRYYTFAGLRLANTCLRATTSFLGSAGKGGVTFAKDIVTTTRELPWPHYRKRGRDTAARARKFLARKRTVWFLLAVLVIIQTGGTLTTKSTGTATTPPQPSTATTGPRTIPGGSSTPLPRTDRLRNWKMNSLYSLYTGIPKGKSVPDNYVLDAEKQFKIMWDAKVKKSHNPVVTQLAAQLRSEFANGAGDYVSLADYKLEIEKRISFDKSDIDWTALASLEQYSAAKRERIRLVRDICMSVNGTDILAYALTELMPTAHGDLNVQVASFMLKQGGRRYFEGIPAMGDKKTSWGPFQMTEFALCYVGEDCRGASIVNQARSQPTPDSVAHLRGMQHFDVGYEFMVHNISTMVRLLSEEEYQFLKAHWREKRDELIAFAATAHHMPGRAYPAARRWLDNKTRKSYLDSCPKRLVQYGGKTLGNLKALRDEESITNLKPSPEAGTAK